MKTTNKAVKTNKVAVKKTATNGKAKVSSKKNPAGNANLLAKLQDLIEENEETIHLILEIAAISIEKSEMSKRKKKISQAALNFIAEVLNIEDDSPVKAKSISKK